MSAPGRTPHRGFTPAHRDYLTDSRSLLPRAVGLLGAVALAGWIAGSLLATA